MQVKERWNNWVFAEWKIIINNFIIWTFSQYTYKSVKQMTKDNILIPPQNGAFFADATTALRLRYSLSFELLWGEKNVSSEMDTGNRTFIPHGWAGEDGCGTTSLAKSTFAWFEKQNSTFMWEWKCHQLTKMPRRKSTRGSVKIAATYGYFHFNVERSQKPLGSFSINGVHYRYLSIILKVFIIKALLVIYKMMYTKVIRKSSSDFKKLR